MRLFYLLFIKVCFIFLDRIEGILRHSKAGCCDLPVFLQTLSQPILISYFWVKKLSDSHSSYVASSPPREDKQNLRPLAHCLYRKSIISSAITTFSLALFYLCNNSGFKIMSWGDINSAPSLLKISSPCKNATVSYGDLLFSFFLL